MKLKRMLAMFLALVMALALAVPAAAANDGTWNDNKVEGEGVERFEQQGGDSFEIGNNDVVVIKRGSNMVVWVSSAEKWLTEGGDLDKEAIKTYVYDKDSSLTQKDGTRKVDCEDIIVGTDSADLHNGHNANNATTINVTTNDNGAYIMTIVGNISHLTFDTEVPEGLRPDDDDGETSESETGALVYTNPDVTEVYKELWHTPVYEKVEQFNQTMVSIPVDMENLPDGVTKLTSKGTNNGFTYLEIDKDALESNEDGATIGIVNKVAHMDERTMAGLTIPTLSPEFPWEEGRLATYTLTLKDGILHMESTLPNFRLTFSNFKTEATVTVGKGKNKVTSTEIVDAYPEHKGAHVGEDVYSWNYDVSELEDNFRVMVHYENNGYYTDKVIGCDATKLIERKCERPVPEANVTVTVKNEAGQDVTNNCAELPAGTYTVIVTVNDKVVDTQNVTVQAGEPTTVTFSDDLTVKGADEYWCAFEDCWNHENHTINNVPETDTEG